MMADLMHRNPTNDMEHRFQMLEHQLRELRASQHELILRQEDQREIRQRLRD
jgi:hypothetical protein